MAINIPIISSLNTKGFDKAKKEFQSLQTASEKTKYILDRALGPAFLAVGAMAVKFGVDAVKAAVEEERSMKLLADQMDRTLGATQAVKDETEKFITKMQNATAVADDKLRPALGNLLTATQDLTTAQDLLGLSIDISVAKGLDLETVSTAIGKAANGNIGALTKLGIPLDENTKKTKDWSEAQKVLNEQFGGAAVSAMDTFSGKAGLVRVQFDDLKEKVGAALMPIIERFLNLLLHVGIPILEELVSQFEFLMKVIEDLAQPFSWFFRTTVGEITALVGSFALLAVAIVGLRAKFIALNTVADGATVFGNLINSVKRLGIEIRLMTKTEYWTRSALAIQHNVTSMQNLAAGTKYAAYLIKGVAKNIVIATVAMGKMLMSALPWVFLVIEAFVLLYKRFEPFRKAVNIIGNALIWLAEKAINGVIIYINRLIHGVRVIASWFGIKIPKSVKFSEVSLERLGETAEEVAARVAAAAAKAAAAAVANVHEMRTRLFMMDERGWGAKEEKEATTGGGGGETPLEKMQRRVKELSDTLKTKMADALKVAEDAARDAQEAFQSFSDTVADSITSGVNFADAWKSGEDSGEFTFSSALHNQFENTKKFAGTIDKLVARGLNYTTLKQVMDAGAETGNKIGEALLNGTDNTLIEKANDMVSTLEELAKTVGDKAAEAFYGQGVKNANNYLDGVRAAFDAANLQLGAKGLKPADIKGIESRFFDTVSSLQPYTPTARPVNINQTINGTLGSGPELAKEVRDLLLEASSLYGPLTIQ